MEQEYGTITLDDSQEQSTSSFSHPDSSRFLITLTCIAAIGGFLFGYDTGVISGAMLLVEDELSLSHIWQELIVSATIGAAAVFALVGGFATDRFGRKNVIITASAIFLLGAMVMAVAWNKYLLLIGRLVVGVALGLVSMSCPMYIAEAAPPHMRGRLVTVNNVFITFGQFVASFIDAIFSYMKAGGWRPMFGLSAIPALVQLAGFAYLPESPRWLIEHRQYDKAKAVLTQIRGNAEIAQMELDDIRVSYEQDRVQRQRLASSSVLFSILQSDHLRRALMVGCGLQLVQQLCGINTVMYYSATIIQMAGVQSIHADIWLAALVAFVNFGAGLFSLVLVERIGRRKLTLASLAGVFVFLIMMGVGFQLMASHSDPVTTVESVDDCSYNPDCDQCTGQTGCGFCFSGNASSCLPINENDRLVSLDGSCNSTGQSFTFAVDWCPTDYYWIVIVGMICYLVSFSPGMGPMPWTINSEIYPQWARSTGNACSTATNWASNLLVSLTFLSLMDAFSKQGAYYIYASISLLGIAFFYWTLPETKGQTLEEVEGLFSKPWVGPRPSKQDDIMHLPLAGSID